MGRPELHDSRLTEQRNPRTADIDIASTGEVVDLMNAEDRGVAEAVHEARDAITRAIDLAVAAFATGGRLIYIGAGTSGRLGVLDASECPPTFGSPPEQVIGIIAGGPEALMLPQEGAEDDVEAGAMALDDLGVTTRDVVVGITASGGTPYVRGALSRARELGATTALVTCTEPPDAVEALSDETIVVRVGPEALTGSTRLKAGTATKMVLNTITTGAMILSGRAYGNLMVDLMATSEKLRDRGERIVMEAGGVDRGTARRAIEAAGGSVKVAVVAARAGIDADEARRRLEAAGGSVRAVAGEPPPVTP
jgi:N-acetylmuramic acid 6-phosphate etherase